MNRMTIAAALLGLAACGSPEGDGSPERGATTAPVADPSPTPAPAPAAAPAVAEPDPGRYSSLDPAHCRLVAENREEGSYARHACPGLGGYRLERSESDLRHDLVVIAPDGRRSELQLSALVARGAFNDLGDTAEWRGQGDDPRTLIVRLDVAPGPEPTRPDISNLVVARLAAPACVVAVVPPGEGQNARARQIADADPLPDCIRR